MASSDRTAIGTLDALKKLEQSAAEYDFFQALRLLERSFPDRPRIGHSQRTSEDPIRLAQEPSLAFAPSTLASFDVPTDGRPSRLNVRFFGLFGPNGPLPLHLTEYARERIRHHHDPTFARFLDIFHHRLISLFYRAWADAQPTVQYDRPQQDRFADYVGSLCGLGMPEFRSRDAVPDLTKLHFAGRLAAQSKCPEGLARILSEFFQLQVRIEEFVGQWAELPVNYQCQLGEVSDTGYLGESTTIGSHIWDCQQRFRIVMGPMGWPDYQRLLPGGAGLERLADLVRGYIGDELLWELNLILQRPDTPALELGVCGQLGRSSWLSPESLEHDADDLVLTDRD